MAIARFIHSYVPTMVSASEGADRQAIPIRNIFARPAHLQLLQVYLQSCLTLNVV